MIYRINIECGVKSCASALCQRSEFKSTRNISNFT